MLYSYMDASSRPAAIVHLLALSDTRLQPLTDSIIGAAYHLPTAIPTALPIFAPSFSAASSGQRKCLVPAMTQGLCSFAVVVSAH